MQNYDPLKSSSFFPKGVWPLPLPLLQAVPKASRKTAPALASAMSPAGRDAVPGSEPFQQPRPPPATPGCRARGSRPGPASWTPPLRSRAVPRLRGPLATHTQHRHTHRHTLLTSEGRGGHDPRKWIPVWRAPRRGGVDCGRPGPGRLRAAAAARGLAPTAVSQALDGPL